MFRYPLSTIKENISSKLQHTIGYFIKAKLKIKCTTTLTSELESNDSLKGVQPCVYFDSPLKESIDILLASFDSLTGVV